MDAITVKKKKAAIDFTRCIGCGVCIMKCEKNKAIRLRERRDYTPPADTMAEFWLNRYFDIKGRSNDLVPKLSLGAARVLAKINPIHITGPRAKTFR
jgi:electron transport complex protein RnfB